MQRLMKSNWGAVLVICLTIVATSAMTATAAKLITGKQIKNSSVTGADIKNSSLRGADVKDGSIAGADLQDGGVAGTDVQDGSLTGTDIQDGSIAGADLQAGAVPPPPISVATSTAAFAAPGLAFGDVTGMGLTHTVPAGGNKIVVTFSAECTISHTAASQYLSVRVLVDGVEAEPAGGVGNQFCTVDGAGPGDTQPVDASIQRVASVSPGAHTVQVQAAEIIVGTGLLDDMALTVMSGS